MSATQSPVASSTATPSTSPNSNTSTLLFGFLVSALSFFAVFMTSAIVWNRLIARRRAIDSILAPSPPMFPRSRRPKMWDIRTMPDKQPPPWPDFRPVAAQQYDRPQTVQTEQTPPSWRHHIFNRLPPEITYIFYRPIPPVPLATSDDLSQVELSHGSDIQVSLLIAMPHPPSQERMHDNYEMVFATTNVLYYDPVS